MTIGLALGSGGWRGLAHIGVIKSLIKHGFDISAVTGTSSGAIVGGLFCLSNDIAFVEKTFSGLKYRDLIYAFSDPSQKLGFFRGLKTLKLFRKFTGDATIEHLKIPFKAVATDLISGERYVFDSGDLSTALRASSSIPVIFEPVLHEGKILVDGGMVNPVPVELAREMGSDIVIAVNVYHCIFPLQNPKKNLNRLNVITLSEQLMLNELSERDASTAEIVVNPALEHAQSEPFYKFINNQSAIDSGEIAMDALIPKLIKLIDSGYGSPNNLII